MTVTQLFNAMFFKEKSYEYFGSFFVDILSKLSHDCLLLLYSQVFENSFSFFSETSFNSSDTDKKLKNSLAIKESSVPSREILLG